MTPEMPDDPIGEVLAEMASVRDRLPSQDGLGVFIDVYRQVTELVRMTTRDGTFVHPEFVEHLDVVFARIFLDVPRGLDAGREVSPAWEPLVIARARPGVLPIQFALAGMNAHINHDLAVAVVSTCQQRGVPPDTRGVHDDYERINDLLARVVRPMRQSFLDEQVVQIGSPLSPLADLVSIFSIDKARDAAWVSALALWQVRDIPFLAQSFERSLSQTVGLIGAQLLVSFGSGE